MANALLTAARSDPFTAQVVASWRQLALRAARAPTPGGGGAAVGASGSAGAGTADDTVSWDTAGTQTNFYSQGNDGAVATTALAAQALLTAGGLQGSGGQGPRVLDGLARSKRELRQHAGRYLDRALLLAAKTGTEAAIGSFDVDVDGTAG